MDIIEHKAGKWLEFKLALSNLLRSKVMKTELRKCIQVVFLLIVLSNKQFILTNDDV